MHLLRHFPLLRGIQMILFTLQGETVSVIHGLKLLTHTIEDIVLMAVKTLIG